MRAAGNSSRDLSLIYRVSVAARYFGGPLPTDTRLSDEPPTHPVPAETRVRAQRVWRAIGVNDDPRQPLAPLVTKLVDWFRGFSVGDPPPDVEGDFVDLALARRGSCRHRSFCLHGVTALSLGIPARLVQNELHVYVEIFLYDKNAAGGYWRRIDLGGALTDPLIVDEAHHTPHHPRAGDPFAPPKAPDSNGATARGTSSTPGSKSGGTMTGGSSGAGAGAVRDQPATTGNAATRRTATAISVTLTSSDAFAGDSATVRGKITADHASPSGAPRRDLARRRAAGPHRQRRHVGRWSICHRGAGAGGHLARHPSSAGAYARRRHARAVGK